MERSMRLNVRPLWGLSLLLLLLPGNPVMSKPPEKLKLNPLSPEEKRVIVNKGTERAFAGEYWNHFKPGWYACRQCDLLLYRSDDKFKSECGWPSFDDELPGVVRRVPDADGIRTEIVCARCGGHLGHVFLGEHLTPKDTRHCVNSISVKFIPEDRLERAIFAGGCFWSIQHKFAETPGVLATRAGYTGGDVKSPTYKQVCTDRTGHAEAVEVIYDPKKTSFEKLAKLFFEIHDPTQLNRQGPDVGKQYRSSVFYTNEEQKKTAEKLLDELRANGYRPVTKVAEAEEFWPAEAYHQHYFRQKGLPPSCGLPVKRFDTPAKAPPR